MKKFRRIDRWVSSVTSEFCLSNNDFFMDIPVDRACGGDHCFHGHFISFTKSVTGESGKGLKI